MKLEEIQKAFKNGSVSQSTDYFHNLYNQCVKILEDLSNDQIDYLIKTLGKEPITFYAYDEKVRLGSATCEKEEMKIDSKEAWEAFKRKDCDSICIKVNLINNTVNFISSKAFNLNELYATFKKNFSISEGGGFIVKTQYLT